MMIKNTAIYFLVTFILLQRTEAVPQKTLIRVPQGQSSRAPQGSELWQELTGENLNKFDDKRFYSEIIAQYHTRDAKGLSRYLEALLRRYPASPYADNALYLGGELALEMKNYPDALRYFQRITRSYPLSNRVVAAQFSKGIAYKKMNLDVQAKKVFYELRMKYPGSPESFRAETELKLIR
jgi:outer membrane protein assembly factor BamD (BamD/ComL family)